MLNTLECQAKNYLRWLNSHEQIYSRRDQNENLMRNYHGMVSMITKLVIRNREKEGE